MKAAGVSKDIILKLQPFQQFEQPAEKSIIITNPPYGERISTNDLLGLYNMIGERLKHAFVGNDAWILSYREECFDQIGLKPSVKLPYSTVLWNVNSVNIRFSTVNIRNSKAKKAVMKTVNVLRRKEESSSRAGRKAVSEEKEDHAKNVIRNTETEDRENSKATVSPKSKSPRRTKPFRTQICRRMNRQS